MSAEGIKEKSMHAKYCGNQRRFQVGLLPKMEKAASLKNAAFQP